MCGFTGFLQPVGFSIENAKGIAKKMARQIAHRGPDDGGVWADADAGIVLAHRRLAILDLSPAGHQPMVSGSGRFVIAFNGEIYNHLLLRENLESAGQAPQWRGHSDTETLLAGFEVWGFEATLRKSVGMFAIALWDRTERVLYLARDRMGEKPLYYGWQNNLFLFGSELKAFKAHPAFQGEINRDALTLLLRHNCIPAPHSIYRGIYKLPPATALRIIPGTVDTPEAYWSLKEVAEQGQSRHLFMGNDEESVAELEGRLLEAVGLQMIADVPLGAFLSGGIDSSTIVALMQAQSSRPVRTFSIGFNEHGYDEAIHAKAVAQHLGTNHTELYVTPEEAMRVIPRLSTLYDEPFSDSSQIPTFLVSQIAKQHVSVSLSGDAGDELFGGYSRYLAMNRLWRKIKWLPYGVRKNICLAINAVPLVILDSIGKHFVPQISQLSDKARKIAEVCAAPNPEAVYHRLVSHWKSPEDVVIGAGEPTTILTNCESWPAIAEFEQRMMYLDSITYLPDDILVKVDRAAMGISLETRVPLLDHRVVELAWQLPIHMKIRDGQGKWILRQVLYKHVPKKLIERPKMGFSVPIESWLRGPLREWAEELLSENRLKQEGFFHPGPIRLKWSEHLSGIRNWHYYLWDVLMFQAWLEAQES